MGYTGSTPGSSVIRLDTGNHDVDPVSTQYLVMTVMVTILFGSNLREDEALKCCHTTAKPVTTIIKGLQLTTSVGPESP